MSLSSVTTAQWWRLAQASVSEGGLGTACPAGNILPRASEAMGSRRRGTRPCPAVSGASEDTPHCRVRSLPFRNRTRRPQEIPCTAWDSHFTTETAAKKKVPVSGGDPVCHVLTQPGKRFFFPVEIIYTGFLCDGPWEQCSSHIITAALFSRSPLPKLGDLPSQGEDDRALHQACNFPGCKNFNSPFHLPMSAWGFSPSGGLSLKSSASKPQGKKRWLGPLWFSSQCTYPKLFF